MGGGVRWSQLRSNFEGLPRPYIHPTSFIRVRLSLQQANGELHFENKKTMEGKLVGRNEKRPVRGVFACLLAETEGFTSSAESTVNTRDF